MPRRLRVAGAFAILLFLHIASAGVAGVSWLPSAAAQSSDPAPYLHTGQTQAATRKSTRHTAAARKKVPVVAPRHSAARRARQAETRVEPKREVRSVPKEAGTKTAVRISTKSGSRVTAKEREAPAKEAPAPALPKKPAPPPLPPNVGPSTGLPLPRYAALKSDLVNMRSGPGERYPVLWTYQRRDLPMKIEHEFDIWRQVEDMDGIKGWMQQGFLVGHRTFVTTGTDDRTLRADAQETAAPVAVLKPGVVGRIKSCEAGKDWCQVQVQDYRGWLKRSDFWGTDPGEAVAP